MEVNNRTLLIHRTNIPEVGVNHGDVNSIIPYGSQVGVKVNKPNHVFILVNVIGLPKDIEEEFYAKTRTMIPPAPEDPMYEALASDGTNAGNVTVDLETFLRYTVVV